MEGGTGASPAIFQEHSGIPTLAAVCEARAALEDCGQYGEIQLIIAGGIRDGADAAKAMALGADAVYIGTAALIALNCNKPLTWTTITIWARSPAIATIATQGGVRWASPPKTRN